MVFVQRMKFFALLFFIVFFHIQIVGMAETTCKTGDHHPSDFRTTTSSFRDDVDATTKTRMKDEEISSYSEGPSLSDEAILVIGVLAQKTFACMKDWNDVRVERNEFAQLLQNRYKNQMTVKKEDIEQDIVHVFKAIKSKISEQMQEKFKEQKDWLKAENLAKKIACNRVKDIFKQVVESKKDSSLRSLLLDYDKILSVHAKTIAAA